MNSSDKKNVVNVIIPTFRRPQLLKRAIESVLEQTYPHFQLCIYDDASQDDTEELVAQFSDPRIHYYLHRENVGLNNNYNFALGRVNTPFFIFLSDDDLFMPSFLEEAMKGFEQHPEAGIFVGGLIYVDKNKRLMGIVANEEMAYGLYSSKDIILETMKGRFASLINAMVFRKETRDEIGVFNDKIWFDVDFITRVSLQFPVIISPVSCIIYLLHSNISHKSSIREYWDMKIRVRELILNSDKIVSEEKEQADRAMREEMRNFIFGMVYQRFVTCRFEESLNGIDLLEGHYTLNYREKTIKFFSKLFIKTPGLVCFFVFSLKLWRNSARMFHFNKIKRKMGQENYKAFKQTVYKI